MLVGGLRPAATYWYRFTDEDGNGSRIGRTITAPAPDDARPVRFAFVSCQDVNEGTLNAYRRMIFEDERAAPPTSSASCCTSATSSTRWSEYPEEAEDAATTARSTRSRASPTARRSATSTSR